MTAVFAMACPQFLNGNLNAASSAFASASVFAVVAIVMFMPADRVDLVVLDFRKNDLLLDAQVEVAAAVEGSPDTPRKSRTRGSAIDTSRSRNSYIRSWRSVTMQPIG